MPLIFSNKKWAIELEENETVNQLFKVNKSPIAVWSYSQAYFAWDLLFCSWQIWYDANTMKIVEWWLGNQTKQVCRNISYLLEENWLSLKDIVKTTIYIKDINNYNLINEVYKNYFVLKPARSIVEVSNLPKNSLVMIEAIARR